VKPKLACAIAAITIALNGVRVSARPLPPLAIRFINHANVPGLWYETTRSEFIEAMNIAAANVSSRWLHGRKVLVGSDLRSKWRLIVVAHPLSYDGQPAAGFHWHDAMGPYAVLTLRTAASQAQLFLDGSHELSEMLVDPSARRFINGWYAEIADAVVCCHYDAELSDGAVEPLNDFVLPHWFVRKAMGPYDFINSPYVQHPLEVGPDGFKQHR
jgi:hypothetical protein